MLASVLINHVDSNNLYGVFHGFWYTGTDDGPENEPKLVTFLITVLLMTELLWIHILIWAQRGLSPEDIR